MFKFPYTNLHELNLDWILEKVKKFSELIPPMETAVEDVQSLQGDVEQAVKDVNQAVQDAQSAIETAEEAKEIAEQAASGTIADGAVTTPKLADGAVTSAKIADGSISGNDIAQGTIQTGNLSEGCVTSDKILDGTIQEDDIGAGAVTNAKILDSAITSVKLADNAVVTAKIADSAVTYDKLNSNAKNESSSFNGPSGDGYCKMPDGTLICWGNSSYNIGTTITSFEVTFPVPFLTGTNPAITLSTGAGGGRIYALVEDVLNSGFTFTFPAMPSATTSWARYIAIGKWK